MNISHLTSGNWSQDEAIAAIESFYNAVAVVHTTGEVWINRTGNHESVTGWVPAKTTDAAKILLYGGPSNV